MQLGPVLLLVLPYIGAMNERLKYLFELVLVPIAAAFVFVEQILIRYLNIAMAAFARWTPVARVEAFLKGLPARWALLVFVMPSIIILPVKLSSFWFLAHGQFAMAFIAVALGKIFATALLGRLYKILRPNLMTLPWFAWADTKFFAWRDWAYAFVRSIPAWRKAKRLAEHVRARAAEFAAALFGQKSR